MGLSGRELAAIRWVDKPPIPSADELAAAYEKYGSTKAAGQVFGCCGETFAKYCRIQGVPIRPPGAHPQKKSHPWNSGIRGLPFWDA